MEEKKSKYSEAQNKATQKYIKENLEEIKFRVKKGVKQYYKDAAAKAGLSMAQFFITAAEEKISRDKIYGDLESSDISKFYGITIKMFPNSESPVVHALRAEENGTFDISNLAMINGDLEERAQAFVIEWIETYKDELLEMWNNNTVKHLPPLE